MNLLEKAKLAERAARASGEMLEHHGAFRVARKAENDFVTEMDYRSEALIRDTLLTACPEDQFFGEESGGATETTGRWVVDPIDGTANYMRGHRLYTISIAYEKDGEYVIGCVYCPGTDELFLAVRGHGATLNGDPIHVSDTPLSDAIVHLGFGHRIPENRARTLNAFPAIMRSVSDVRRSGTAAYDLCCVAAGRSDAFIELGLSQYDYAAGYVILTEAGGRFTGWEQDEDGIESGNLLTSNGVVHEALRGMLLGNRQ